LLIRASRINSFAILTTSSLGYTFYKLADLQSAMPAFLKKPRI
jgi:hypothetical protein